MESKEKTIILIIDDQPANLKVLATFLQEQDYDIRIHESGERALEMLQQTLPDLILLDVMMPGMDGFAICRAIKADPRSAGIPVVFLTALDAMEDKVAGFEAGGADYITKPFQKVEVLSRLNTHLSLRKKEKELRKAVDSLQVQSDNLELQVRERTSALLESTRRLEEKQREVEKKNIALKVLLDQYQLKQADLQGQIAVNLRKLVYPYLTLLEGNVTVSEKEEYLALIRGHLDSFSQTLSTQCWNLTPKESLVADLVKQGRSTREIGRLLKISPRTAETYRNAIRKKVGLTNKKTRLNTYLRSISETV